MNYMYDVVRREGELTSKRLHGIGPVEQIDVLASSYSPGVSTVGFDFFLVAFFEGLGFFDPLTMIFGVRVLS